MDECNLGIHCDDELSIQVQAQRLNKQQVLTPLHHNVELESTNPA